MASSVSLIILLAGFVLLVRAQQQTNVSGSGEGSGTPSVATGDPPEELCLTLPSDHPCYNLSGRGPNHALPQTLPVAVDIDDFVLRIAFALTSTMQTADPPECQEAVQHYICLLGVPPCDPDSQRPLQICDRSCQAYNKLVSDGGCDSTVAAIQDLAISSNNQGVFLVLGLYEEFDCENVSTYYYFETDMYADTCTNLLSMESEERVLNPTLNCVEVTSSACSALYPMPYYVPVEERVESNVFAEVSAASSILDHFCGDSLITLACSYIFPACNPERGTQLPVCSDGCSLLRRVKEICSDQFNQIKAQNDTGPFIQYLDRFNCSDPQSYLVAGVPVDEEECISAHDFFDLSEEESDNSLFVTRVVAIVFGSVGVVLMIALAFLIIACVYSRTRMKTYYRQWAYSIERRHRIARSKEECELTQIKQNVATSIPWVVNATVLMGVEDEDAGQEVKLTPADVKKYESQFSGSVFHYDSLEMKEAIGEGAFGKVYFSILNAPDREMKDIQVAVKTIKNIYSEEQLREFLAESLIMKDFHHPHIVGLLGVCFDTPDGSPYIVLPFMANGSLKKYLKGRRVHVLDIDSFPKGLSQEMLTHMCIDIAEGMAYLADHKFVHRDLAARNCMLNSELSVLVGDFGLARDIYVSAYYRAGKGAKLPVKWMPPEALHDGISNEKTDVWSYGVTCWEVFSLGRTPYPGVENHEILDYITDGKRPKKPSLCPETLYEIFSQCWHYTPEDRPTFEGIVSSLKEYWDEEHFYMVQSFTA